MSRTIAVSDDLYSKALEFATRDSLSVEEFVSAVLADQLAQREFIDSRARLFDRDAFDRALDCIPDVEPGVHDAI
jgi:hypothetical protein